MLWPYNYAVKCNLDIGSKRDLQSGSSNAIQVTPFCEVSISSHNRGFMVTGTWVKLLSRSYQNGVLQWINQLFPLCSSLSLDGALKSWLIGFLWRFGPLMLKSDDLSIFMLPPITLAPSVLQWWSRYKETLQD